MHVFVLPPFFFIKIKKNWNSNLNQFQQRLFYTFPPLTNLIFLVIVLIPRFLKANFLQRGMHFFLSFTCLCISDQDPSQEL